MTVTYLQVTGTPNCGREVIAVVANALTKSGFQAMRDICGRLCSNESVMNVRTITFLCC